MALPKKVSEEEFSIESVRSCSLIRALYLNRRRQTISIPDEFQHMILCDCGAANHRMIMIGKNALLDGFTGAKLWLAGGTFKVVPSIFFQLFTIQFELAPGINPVAILLLCTEQDSSCI